jgi:hypothetical protein
MSLDEKFIPIRTWFYQMVESLLKKIAGLFGYPGNPGMPIAYDLQNEADARSKFLENLPSHRTFGLQYNDQKHGLKQYLDHLLKLMKFQDMYMRTETKAFIIFILKILKICISCLIGYQNFFKSG